jgi:uncharacterized Zn-finger protein
MVQAIHEKPFLCNICFNEFKNINALTQHIDIHEELIFKCNSCETLTIDQ